jgi:GNAT superfamily N-acetyltransferase
MEVLIRPAVPADANEIVTLIQELAIYEKHQLEDVKITPEIIRRDGFGEHPLFQILMAEVDKKLVGYAFYFYTYSAIRAARNIYLEDLYVRPDYRAMNIGRKLLSVLAQITIAKQCRKLEWLVLGWNEMGIKFYEKIGATFRHEMMKATLASPMLEKLAELE